MAGTSRTRWGQRALIWTGALLLLSGVALGDKQRRAKKAKGSSAPASQPVELETPGPFPLPKDLPKKARFVVIELHDEVNLGMVAFVERAEQILRPGDILLVDIKTFGGRVDAAVNIRDTLLHVRDKKARVVAFINPRAISAGALIAYATDVIVVSPGATMGAATPIQMEPGKGAKAAGEKVVSYMRQEMRSTAEARGRRGDVAEAMVDADAEVKGLIKKGKLLTLNGKSALKWAVASFEAQDRAAVIKGLGYDKASSYTVIHIQASWADKIGSWLSSTAVAGLLMTIGMLGLMIGLYSGGSPIPLSVGAACLLLFFFGHYITHLAGIEDVLLFVLGLVLIGVEVFVPGMVLPGIAGVVCVLGALFMGLVDFDKVPFSVQWDSGHVVRALAVVFGSLFATTVLGALAIRFLPGSSLGRSFVLSTAVTGSVSERDEDGDDEVVGQIGTAISDLRPSGKVTVQGQRYDAVAQLGFVMRGTPVQVVRRQGYQLVVKPQRDDSESYSDAGSTEEQA